MQSPPKMLPQKKRKRHSPKRKPSPKRIGFILGAATVLAGVCLYLGIEMQIEARRAGGRASSSVPAPSLRALTGVETVAAGAPPERMVWIPGGEFLMGAENPSASMSGGHDSKPDASPRHRVIVDGFWMDQTEVTNAQFERFVAATGHVTTAEEIPRAEDFPGAPATTLVAGSVVFAPTAHAVPLNDHFQWWTYVKDANWRHPDGPASDLRGRENHPVVHVSYADALAYAKWAGKRLPTEAEWEFAARGGLTGQLYTWGNELRPGGRWMANIYEGKFPTHDTGEDGFAGIAPVGQYPVNGYGLHDIGGNVWEWCADWYRSDYYAQLAAQPSPARNPQGPAESFDPAEPGTPKRVHRGGSFLCNDQYCTRYMVGTRGKGEPDTGTNHLGFRCVKSAP